MFYCPRQCALIHLEQRWEENRFTAEGRVLHERSDAGSSETRDGVRVERNVPLRSFRLGISGMADVIETRKSASPYPIEYKRGRPKKNRADEIQLCAQAICLEEMLGMQIHEGALFYGKNRRRKIVTFDAELRELTRKAASTTRQMLMEGKIPLPEYSPQKCNACSLLQVCQPLRPCQKGLVNRWLSRAIEE